MIDPVAIDFSGRIRAVVDSARNRRCLVSHGGAKSNVARRGAVMNPPAPAAGAPCAEYHRTNNNLPARPAPIPKRLRLDLLPGCWLNREFVFSVKPRPA